MGKAQFNLPVLGIIFNGNKVLLVQRHNPETKYSHKKWAFPGGEIEFGEHPNETVTREVKEETGIEIDIVEKGLFVENHVFESENIHVICLCYPAKYKKGELDTSKDNGTLDAKWFEVDNIDYSICLPKTKEILEKALQHI